MQVQKEDIKRSILEISLKEFSLKGYNGASLNEIASQCKISKSNLYRYFPSKQSIYDTLMASVKNEIRREMEYLTGGGFVDTSADVTAMAIVDRLYPIICEHRREVLILMKESDTGHEPMKEELIATLANCFFHFDGERMPANFTHVLASMLVDGIYRIVKENEEEQEIRQQLLALFRYHARGTCAFTEDNLI